MFKGSLHLIFQIKSFGRYQQIVEKYSVSCVHMTTNGIDNSIIFWLKVNIYIMGTNSIHMKTTLSLSRRSNVVVYNNAVDPVICLSWHFTHM
jgi:hypothetical protein